MKFKGSDGEKFDVVVTEKIRYPGDHNHLEIRKGGTIQWYLHIQDNHITMFSGGYDSNRPVIKADTDRDMVKLTKEV